MPPIVVINPNSNQAVTDGLDAAQDGRGWHAEVASRTCRRASGADGDAAALAAALAPWCDELAERGGDDATVALLWRGSATTDS